MSPSAVAVALAYRFLYFDEVNDCAAVCRDWQSSRRFFFPPDSCHTQVSTTCASTATSLLSPSGDSSVCGGFMYAGLSSKCLAHYNELIRYLQTVSDLVTVLVDQRSKLEKASASLRARCIPQRCRHFDLRIYREGVSCRSSFAAPPPRHGYVGHGLDAVLETFPDLATRVHAVFLHAEFTEFECLKACPNLRSFVSESSSETVLRTVCRFKKLARLELPQLTSAYSSLVYVNHSFTALEYLAVGAFPVYRTLLDFELTAAVKTLIVGKVVEDAQLMALRDNNTLTALEVGRHREPTRLSTGFLSLMYMPLQSLVLRDALAFRSNTPSRAPLRSVDVEFTAPLFLSRLHTTLQSLSLHRYQAGQELDAAIGSCTALTTLCLVDGDLSYDSLTFFSTRLHRLQRLSVGGISCCQLPSRLYSASIPARDLCLHFEAALSGDNRFLALRCFQWSNSLGATLYLNAGTHEVFRQTLRDTAHPHTPS